MQLKEVLSKTLPLPPKHAGARLPSQVQLKQDFSTQQMPCPVQVGQKRGRDQFEDEAEPPTKKVRSGLGAKQWITVRAGWRF